MEHSVVSSGESRENQGPGRGEDGEQARSDTENSRRKARQCGGEAE